MRILVDAMGGDNAPDQIALGAIQAAKDFGCEAVLCLCQCRKLY